MFEEPCDDGGSLKDSGDYVLGHSAQELERLNAQARIIDPITRRFLEAAGIGAGKQVLDVGSGAGDAPDAWRSAHRILEHHWGKPPEYIAPTAHDDVGIDDLDKLSDAELAALVKRLRPPERALGERQESAADTKPLTAVASG